MSRCLNITLYRRNDFFAVLVTRCLVYITRFSWIGVRLLNDVCHPFGFAQDRPEVVFLAEGSLTTKRTDFNIFEGVHLI